MDVSSIEEIDGKDCFTTISPCSMNAWTDPDIVGDSELPSRPLLSPASWFHKLARTNSAVAQFNLGICYFYGSFGVETQDINQALFWLERAADPKSGNEPRAQYFVGQLYENGIFVIKDMAKAWTLYSIAAENNHAPSLYQLALCYEMGYDNIERDVEAAISLYTRAALLKHAPSQNALGYLSYTGAYGKRSLNEAMMWFQFASDDSDHGLAQYNRGISLMDRGSNERVIPKSAPSPNDAAYWFAKASEKEIPEAMYMLGRCYIDGSGGLIQDCCQAMHWFAKASAMDHPESQYELGMLYYFGKPVVQDFHLARKWFHASASQGHEMASYWCRFLDRYLTKDIVHRPDMSGLIITPLT